MPPLWFISVQVYLLCEESVRIKSNASNAPLRPFLRSVALCEASNGFCAGVRSCISARIGGDDWRRIFRTKTSLLVFPTGEQQSEHGEENGFEMHR